jgi:hypothetical protein
VPMAPLPVAEPAIPIYLTRDPIKADSQPPLRYTALDSSRRGTLASLSQLRARRLASPCTSKRTMYL